MSECDSNLHTLALPLSLSRARDLWLFGMGTADAGATLPVVEPSALMPPLSLAARDQMRSCTCPRISNRGALRSRLHSSRPFVKHSPPSRAGKSPSLQAFRTARTGSSRMVG